ncbi:MAG: hypothetical protein JNM56_12455 [Planctomycetia bacterium]|nr:hypothetical protein [Planctomycetia bacterium]
MLRPFTAAAVLLLTAATAQAGLEIQNIQAAYGPLLPERKALEYYSLDLIYFRYLVSGAKTDAQGQVDVEATVKLLDANGKEVHNQKVPYKGSLSLGGDAFAGAVYLSLNEQFLSGTYKLVVEHTDYPGTSKAAFEREIKIKSTEFALVFPRFSYDAEGRILAPPGGLVHQSLYFRIGVIGFDRTGDRVELVSHVQLLDAQGKELLPKALETVIKENDPKTVKATDVANFSGSLGLHRPGDFTLRITVTDRRSEKTTRFEMPLRVAFP